RTTRGRRGGAAPLAPLGGGQHATADLGARRRLVGGRDHAARDVAVDLGELPAVECDVVVGARRLVPRGPEQGQYEQAGGDGGHDEEDEPEGHGRSSSISAST